MTDVPLPIETWNPTNLPVLTELESDYLYRLISKGSVPQVNKKELQVSLEMAQNTQKVLVEFMTEPLMSNAKFVYQFNEYSYKHLAKHLIRVKKMYLAKNAVERILKEMISLDAHFHLNS